MCVSSGQREIPDREAQLDVRPVACGSGHGDRGFVVAGGSLLRISRHIDIDPNGLVPLIGADVVHEVGDVEREHVRLREQLAGCARGGNERVRIHASAQRIILRRSFGDVHVPLFEDLDIAGGDGRSPRPGQRPHFDVDAVERRIRGAFHDHLERHDLIARSSDCDAFAGGIPDQARLAEVSAWRVGEHRKVRLERLAAGWLDPKPVADRPDSHRGRRRLGERSGGSK
jgi:hypothetical protein